MIDKGRRAAQTCDAPGLGLNGAFLGGGRNGSRNMVGYRWVRACAVLGLLIVPVIGGCDTGARPAEGQKSSAGGVDSGGKAGVKASEGRPKIEFSEFLGEKKLATPPVLREVAAELGYDFRYFNDAREKRYFFPEILGGGFACLDYDLDGWPDLYSVNGRALPLSLQDTENWDRLSRNVAGRRLADVTGAAFVAEGGYGHGSAYGDLNADGFDDLVIAGFGSISILLNQGDGTFERLPPANFPYDPTWSVSPVIVDLNLDGLPEILVTNYVKWNYEVPACTYDNIRGYCGPGEFDAVRDYVFENRGDGVFVETGLSWGFEALGKGLAVAAVDWDHDLRPEVYIANDLVANFYYGLESERPTLYREQAGRAGVGVCVNGWNEASMSVTVGDFTSNGWADIFVTNYYKQKNTLYSNTGQGQFRDVSFAARTQKTGEMFLGFGAVGFDFDKDGWLDLFIGNGHVLGPEHLPNQLTNQVLHNDQGAFDDVSSQAGDFFQIRTLSRGVVTFDFDLDLDTDIVVNHLDRPVSILRNDTVTENRSIALQLCHPRHAPLEGSRIEVTQSGRTQVLPVVAGGSYLTDSQREWIIGAGDKDRLDQVVVYWRDGQVDRWEGLETGVRWQFQPGQKRRL